MSAPPGPWSTTSTTSDEFGLGTGRPQCHGEGHELLLCTIVEVALEPSPLGIARRDDTRLRLLDVAELRLHMRLELFVLDSQAQGRGDRGDHRRIITGAPVQGMGRLRSGDSPVVDTACACHPRTDDSYPDRG